MAYLLRFYNRIYSAPCQWIRINYSIILGGEIMSIYSAIRDIANNKDISIREIERDLKFSNGSIGKWNKSNPTISKIQMVADYLGVTTGYILIKAKEGNK